MSVISAPGATDEGLIVNSQGAARVQLFRSDGDVILTHGGIGQKSGGSYSAAFASGAAVAITAPVAAHWFCNAGGRIVYLKYLSMNVAFMAINGAKLATSATTPVWAVSRLQGPLQLPVGNTTAPQSYFARGVGRRQIDCPQPGLIWVGQDQLQTSAIHRQTGLDNAHPMFVVPTPRSRIGASCFGVEFPFCDIWDDHGLELAPNEGIVIHTTAAPFNGFQVGGVLEWDEVDW